MRASLAPQRDLDKLGSGGSCEPRVISARRRTIAHGSTSAQQESDKQCAIIRTIPIDEVNNERYRRNFDDLPECFEVFISHRSTWPHRELSDALKAKLEKRNI